MSDRKSVVERASMAALMQEVSTPCGVKKVERALLPMNPEFTSADDAGFWVENDARGKQSANQEKPIKSCPLC